MEPRKISRRQLLSDALAVGCGWAFAIGVLPGSRGELLLPPALDENGCFCVSSWSDSAAEPFELVYTFDATGRVLRTEVRPHTASATAPKIGELL
jgi:hypothetical protein